MPFLAKSQYPISTKDILSWTFDSVNYNWDEPIYIDALQPSTHFITARQAYDTIRKLIAGFRSVGLQPGDCVCLHSFNHIAYPIAFHGIAGSGGVFAGTNPAYTPYELTHTFKTAKVKFVLTQRDLLDAVLKAAKDASIPKERILIFNPDGEQARIGFVQWKSLLEQGDSDWIRFDDLSTSKDTTAARLFSSGTTGLPKAADLSHYNLVAQHTLVHEANHRPWKPRRLLALPFFHAASAPAVFCSPLREGSKGFVLQRFELEKWFWANEKYEITDLAFVPPVAIMVINSPLNEKYSLRSAKIAAVGAAPLDRKPQARLQELIGQHVPLTQVWGMTETSCIATRHPWPQSDITGSVGVPMPGIDTKLVDDDGKDVSAFDVRGELCVRGPTVIRGYFENPEANQRDWDAEGFFHTGDIAFVDGKTGLYYIVDRKKELIKVRAFQVAPPELEGVLLSHPEIVDAAVIGVPDPQNSEGSELPRAYIVRRGQSSSHPTTQQVHDYMRERLASYKMLLGGILFVEAIPKTASGKILKRILREQAKNEMRPKL